MQLSSFFKNAPDAIIVINNQSLVYSWNPKAEEIFGWKAEEIAQSDCTASHSQYKSYARPPRLLLFLLHLFFQFSDCLFPGNSLINIAKVKN